MHPSLEIYLSPQGSKLGNPFAVRSNKLNVYEAVSIIEIYQHHVQRLFDYGMHVCSNRELVTESLLAVFAHVRNQNNLPGTKEFIRLFLFTKFRKHVAQQMSGLKKLHVSGDDMVESPDMFPGRQLTPDQREALFLKLKCEFSYREVAAVMGIRIKSAHKLVSLAFESIRDDIREG